MEETSANILNVIEILQEKFIILSGKQLLSNYITIRQTIIRARVWFFVVVLLLYEYNKIDYRPIYHFNLIISLKKIHKKLQFLF